MMILPLLSGTRILCHNRASARAPQSLPISDNLGDPSAHWQFLLFSTSRLLGASKLLTQRIHPGRQEAIGTRFHATLSRELPL